MARNPAADTARARFAALLSRHLEDGASPGIAEGEPWTDEAFAATVQSSQQAKEFASPRSVSNWRKGKRVPAEIEPILQALFGPLNERNDAARKALWDAFKAARAEKMKRAPRDPAGERWVAENDQFTIDRSSRSSDRAAARDPRRHQLQTAIYAMAEKVVGPAARLHNTQAWAELASTAAAFQALVAGDPLSLPQRLGEAYSLMLQLGQFLETDIRVRHDPASLDPPLEPHLHGLLTNLVRMAAPWLRGFPTVAAWDDAAGKQLVRPSLFQPAREFTRIARAEQAISGTDALEMDRLGDLAEASGYQGQKAGNRVVGGTQNLMLAFAEALATELSRSPATDFASLPLLVRRAAATLAAAESQVAAFAATRPSDLGQALRALVGEAQVLERGAGPAGIAGLGAHAAEESRSPSISSPPGSIGAVPPIPMGAPPSPPSITTNAIGFTVGRFVARSSPTNSPSNDLPEPIADDALDGESAFWRSRAPPIFASARGADEFGPWLEFSVPAPDGAPVTQRLRWIPPGRFLMGSPADEPGRWEEEGPQHRVTIGAGFWLFDTPCTQALWQAVMGNNPSRFKSAQRPVETVSWNACRTFIARVNEDVPGLDLSLPSEAQWEYACRAGTATATYAGALEILGKYDAPGLDPIAWYGGNSGHEFDLGVGSDSTDWPEKQYPHTRAGTRLVKTKSPNAWGLYDMLGNVWEWCADNWHRGYEGAPADGRAWLESNPEGGSERVLRGGSWGVYARSVRSAFRYGGDAGYRGDDVGFRCARGQD
jgi:formylglycine-generating enzyme required for sulfatase activity